MGPYFWNEVKQRKGITFSSPEIEMRVENGAARFDEKNKNWAPLLRDAAVNKYCGTSSISMGHPRLCVSAHLSKAMGLEGTFESGLELLGISPAEAPHLGLIKFPRDPNMIYGELNYYWLKQIYERLGLIQKVAANESA